MISIVAIAKIIDVELLLLIASGSFVNTSIIFFGDAKPKIGNIWKIMIIIPIPLINPERTG